MSEESSDFSKIAADLRIHFCPQCRASFGCETDEDGDCDCKGIEYDWRKPWCPPCVEKEECTACSKYNCRCHKCTECQCTDCREERQLRDSGEGPYDESGPSGMTPKEQILEAIRKDLANFGIKVQI